MRWGNVPRVEKGENRARISRVSVGKPEVKRTLGRLRRRWFYYITMDFSRRGMSNGQDLSDSGQGEVSGCCECGNKLSGHTRCREIPD
jgi:hypothetical protein